MTYHAGQKFSTFDQDNDAWPEGNCAKAHTGAWWYNSCDMWYEYIVCKNA